MIKRLLLLSALVTAFLAAQTTIVFTGPEPGSVIKCADNLQPVIQGPLHYHITEGPNHTPGIVNCKLGAIEFPDGQVGQLDAWQFQLTLPSAKVLYCNQNTVYWGLPSPPEAETVVPFTFDCQTVDIAPG